MSPGKYRATDRLSQLLQHTIDPAFALTARTEIWAWNPAAEAMTRFASSEVSAVNAPAIALGVGK